MDKSQVRLVSVSLILLLTIGLVSATFTGSFDGNGKRIADMYINVSDVTYVGMFGDLNAVTVENLSLVNIDLTSNGDSPNVGGLAGKIYATSIENVNLSGSIHSESADDLFLGGVVGYGQAYGSPTTLNFENVHTDLVIDINGSTGYSFDIGGIVGYDTVSTGGLTTISNCSTSGQIIVDNVAPTYAINLGGLIGMFHPYGGDTYIERCSSDVAIELTDFSGADLAGTHIGGLAGRHSPASGSPQSDAFISDSYFDGSITIGDSPSEAVNVGGISGWVFGRYSVGNARIDNSYFSGTLTIGNVDSTSGVGGLTGFNHMQQGGDIAIMSSFSTGSIVNTSELILGGLFGKMAVASGAGTGVLGTLYWNNHSGNPNVANGSYDVNYILSYSTIQDDLSYFYNNDYTPTDDWDFVNVWDDSNNGTGLPTLR